MDGRGLRGQRRYEASAFTAPGLLGNPALVFVGDNHPTPHLMQEEARRAGLSEIAFAAPASRAEAESGAEIHLRFFAPKAELPQCGHATLAAAGVLLPELGRDEVRFLTGSGVIVARTHPLGVEMDFPADPMQALAVPPRALLGALGIAAPAAVLHAPRSRKLLVEVADPDAVASVRPDWSAMVQAAPDVRGVIVTAPGGPADFVSRYFNPWVGVDEDPVTGNAHCCLAGYWGPRLGKARMVGVQMSARGGRVAVDLRDPGRVWLGGAVQVAGASTGPR